MDVRVGAGIDVRLVVDGRAEPRPLDELEMLIALQEGLVWVDIATCGPEGVRVLTEVFGFHPMAVRDCTERNYVPKLHGYSDHVFMVLHALERGEGGRVHSIELDQFIGLGFLVTVHGPTDPGVDPDVALRHTRAVLRRVEAGRFNPTTSFELSHAITSALAKQQERFVGELARETGRLEQRALLEEIPDPERFLEELFRTRHELLAVRTNAMLSREILARLSTLGRFVPGQSQQHLADLVDQFERVGGVVDAQKEFLQGVIDFYRARTETKMTIAAERLAVIAVVTLPITALSSIYGMNIIVNERTDFGMLAAVLAVMVAMSSVLLTWAKRQGWW
jgi:magnesium transporter